MDFRHKKEHLSFSIENILRDDFSRGVRNNRVKLMPPRSTFTKRLHSASYQLHGVHYYRPMIVRYLPVIYKLDARCLRLNEGNEQNIVTQNPANDKDISGFEDDSSLQHKEGNNYLKSSCFFDHYR